MATRALHYNLVAGALTDSGIRVSITACVADVLLEEIRTDADVLEALRAVVRTVVHKLSVIPSDEHLHPAAAAALRDCIAGTDEVHIESYDAFAAQSAHLATCTVCRDGAGLPRAIAGRTIWQPGIF